MESRCVKNGIVLMLDALGVRGVNGETAVNFLRNWMIVRDAANTFVTEIFSVTGKRVPHAEPNILFVQDTIICYWVVDGFNHLLGNIFIDAMYFASALVKCGIENNILLRGAISVGDYYLQRDDGLNIIIGPSVDDVASWYESAEWFGVIATPSCSLKIEMFLNENRIKAEGIKEFISGIEYYESSVDDIKSVRSSIITNYNVKRKNENINTYVANWPQLVYFEYKDGALMWLYERLSKFCIPNGAEGKFNNSIQFFKTSLECDC